MDHPVVLFDGFCNLCSRTVQTILRADTRERFRFASLQSPAGATVARHLKAQHGRIGDSVILLYKGEIYVKSDAVLRIARLLGGRWSLMLPLWVIPRPFRDSIYDYVAKRRYRWFGQRETCWLPSPALNTRFLNDELPVGNMPAR